MRGFSDAGGARLAHRLRVDDLRGHIEGTARAVRARAAAPGRAARERSATWAMAPLAAERERR